MKTYYLLVFFAAAIFTSALTADTYILKTGVKYEGALVSENDESYVVQIKHSKSIKYERRIPKDQIQSIVKKAEDAIDFEALSTLSSTPDRLPASEYIQRINTTKAFLEKHPESTHAPLAKTILQTLEKEQQIISNGGIKLDGQIITPADMDANAYDVDARILLHEMTKLAANGNYRAALRKWETLTNKYSHSSSYKEGIPITIRILKFYKGELQELTNTLEARQAKRKSVIASLSDGDRERFVRVYAAKREAHQARIEKEGKQHQTQWLTVDPFDKKSLEHNLSNAETTLKLLSSKDPTEITLAGPAYRGAWSALAKNNLEEAGKLLKELSTFQLPAKYIEPLTKKLEVKLTAQQEANKKAAEILAEQERIAQEAAKKAKEEEAKMKKPRRRKKRNRSKSTAPTP